MKYVPLFDSILNSTLWEEDLDVRGLYLTMLLMMDPDFVVREHFAKVAKAANLRKDRKEGYEAAARALAVLQAPDALAAEEQKDEGIRIKQVEEGYLVVNGGKYQDLMYELNSARKRARAQRERRQRERDGMPQIPATCRPPLPDPVKTDGRTSLKKSEEPPGVVRVPAVREPPDDSGYLPGVEEGQ